MLIPSRNFTFQPTGRILCFFACRCPYAHHPQSEKNVQVLNNKKRLNLLYCKRGTEEYEDQNPQTMKYTLGAWGIILPIIWNAKQGVLTNRGKNSRKKRALPSSACYEYV